MESGRWVVGEALMDELSDIGLVIPYYEDDEEDENDDED